MSSLKLYMLQISRKKTKIIPDFKKVIPRFFNTGNERAKQLIERVLAMSDSDATILLNEVLQEFSYRYLDIHLIFDKHYVIFSSFNNINLCTFGIAFFVITMLEAYNLINLIIREPICLNIFLKSF